MRASDFSLFHHRSGICDLLARESGLLAVDGEYLFFEEHVEIEGRDIQFEVLFRLFEPLGGSLQIEPSGLYLVIDAKSLE